jgi:hypothetical protein
MPSWLRAALKVLAGLLVGLAVVGAIVFWGLREHWDTATSLGVAGLVVAVGGFAIAIFEIRNAKSAAQATRKAVTRTLKGVAAVQLIRMIEQLRQAVIDLEDAVHRRDPNGVRRAIRTWRTVGTDAKGHLERRFGAALPALEPLDASIDAARTTMAALRREDDDPSIESASRCLEAMEGVVDQLGPLHERLLPTMDELDEYA